MSRTLLASLLLRGNTALSARQLSENLWGWDAPKSATASLYNHVMRLRKALGGELGDRVRTAPGGYLITLQPGELDLDVLYEHLARGKNAARAGRWAQSAKEFEAGLALWRGEPLADVPVLRDDSRVRRLLEARAQAVEGRIEARIALGRHGEVIGDLRTLIAQEPLREGHYGQLMRALSGTGRRAEALAVFATLRRVLADELGVAPVAELRELHQRLLLDEQESTAPDDREVSAQPRPTPLALVPAVPAGEPAAVRHHLPADVRAFTGRSPELGEITRLTATARTGTAAGSAVVAVISGMAGVGKTALAVRAAHRLRDQFPDGQLFLDLQGHTPGLAPLTPNEALSALLRMLGVQAALIPQDPGERAMFYRDRLRGTSAVIILDNAAGTAQVEPLLPDWPGGLVIVTSRRRLAGLDDTHPLPLSLLRDSDAIALLHHVAGAGRIPSHHPALAELVALGGHLPLAIRLIGTRFRLDPQVRVEDMIARLQDESSRLSHLDGEDQALTSVFAAAYQQLPEAEQHMFRSLGLVPGPDFDAYAAASIAGTTVRRGAQLLEALLEHHLLIQHLPGRFQFHALVLAYARTLPTEPAPALARLLDYYERAAAGADRHLTWQTPVVPGRPSWRSPLVQAATPAFADHKEAIAWMKAERASLLAAFSRASELGLHDRTVRLGMTLASFMEQEGPLHRAADLQEAAVAAARALGDRCTEAGTLLLLGRVRRAQGHYPVAKALYELAWDVYAAFGHRRGQADVLAEQSRLYSVTRGFLDAAKAAKEALAIYRELGDRLGEASVLCVLARMIGLTGDIAEAELMAAEAAAIYGELGNSLGEAWGLCELGCLRAETAGTTQAAQPVADALAFYLASGSRYGVASAYWRLAGIKRTAGDHAAAGELFANALAIYRDLGHGQCEADALYELGRTHHTAGDAPTAGMFLDSALGRYRDLRDPLGEAMALIGKGALALDGGKAGRAADHYRQALDLAHASCAAKQEAEALEGLRRCEADRHASRLS